MIIKDIIGWPYYETWETFHKQAPKDIYPVAFWQIQPYNHSRWSVFHKPERNAVTFDPLHSLNDAWLITERYDVIDLLRIKKSNNYRVQLCKGNQAASATAPTAQDAICIAALRLAGFEVTE